jgi:non-ribosomal peptide synthase protein (TIGR01720 family)
MVRRELARFAHSGIGYGCWRYPDTADASPDASSVAGDVAPELTLNYLGEVGPATAHALFRVVSERHGAVHAPVNLRARVLQINARVVHGRLELVWTYSPRLHTRETVARLANRHVDAVRALVRESVAAAARGDVDLDADLTTQDLEAVSRALAQ